MCVNVSGIKLNVLALCETHFNDAIGTIYSMDGYESYSNNKNTAAGGLAIYVNSSSDANAATNLSLQLPYIECLFLEVTKPEPFLVGMIYRPPNLDFEFYFYPR